MISYLSKSFYGKSVTYEPVENKDSEDESYELNDHSINRFSPKTVKCKNDEMYVLDIKDGQTIQSIALKYNCSVNNFIFHHISKFINLVVAIKSFK